MGGGSSTEIGGVRVFKVTPGSPAAEAGLEVFFDFILEINGVKMDPSGQQSFAKVIQDAENASAKMQVFNTRAHTTREVVVNPRKWAGTGLLGATVRYDVVDPAENHGIRVLEVFPNSPAAHAGMVPFQDFLLGTSQSVFHDIDELVEVVTSNINQRMQVYVYNADSETVREVTMAPNNEWGGDGCIGCDIGTGLLHRIPAPRRMPGGMAPMFPPAAAPAYPPGAHVGIPPPAYPPGVQAQQFIAPPSVPGMPPAAVPPPAMPAHVQAPVPVPAPSMPVGMPGVPMPSMPGIPMPSMPAMPVPAPSIPGYAPGVLPQAPAPFMPAGVPMPAPAPFVPAGVPVPAPAFMAAPVPAPVFTPAAAPVPQWQPPVMAHVPAPVPVPAPVMPTAAGMIPMPQPPMPSAISQSEELAALQARIAQLGASMPAAPGVPAVPAVGIKWPPAPQVGGVTWPPAPAVPEATSPAASGMHLPIFASPGAPEYPYPGGMSPVTPATLGSEMPRVPPCTPMNGAEAPVPVDLAAAMDPAAYAGGSVL